SHDLTFFGVITSGQLVCATGVVADLLQRAQDGVLDAARCMPIVVAKPERFPMKARQGSSRAEPIMSAEGDAVPRHPSISSAAKPPMTMAQPVPKPLITELTERSREIFRMIVEAYVETGEPVGSRTLARRGRLELSPASIRNVMADLEEAGLLF